MSEKRIKKTFDTVQDAQADLALLLQRFDDEETLSPADLRQGEVFIYIDRGIDLTYENSSLVYSESVYFVDMFKTSRVSRQYRGRRIVYTSPTAVSKTFLSFRIYQEGAALMIAPFVSRGNNGVNSSTNRLDVWAGGDRKIIRGKISDLQKMVRAYRLQEE